MTMIPTDIYRVLETISSAPLHSHGIAQRLRQLADHRFHTVSDLYPMLRRAEQAGWLHAHSSIIQGRRLRFYALTPCGRRVLRRLTRGSYRHHCLATAASAVACGMATTVCAAQDPDLPRVRSSSSRIQASMVRGAEESLTFRRLIEALKRTNGIVYIEDGDCGRGVDACLRMSITSTGGFRYLNITVRTERRPDDRDLVATLGHELRHALEILSEPGIKSSSEMFNWYLGKSGEHDGHFETTDAVNAGNQVARELARVKGFRGLSLKGSPP